MISVTQVYLHLFTDIFVSPQIVDEHHQTSCGTWGSSQLLPHVLFCLQLGIGLVGKETDSETDESSKEGVLSKPLLSDFITCFGLVRVE